MMLQQDEHLLSGTFYTKPSVSNFHYLGQKMTSLTTTTLFLHLYKAGFSISGAYQAISQDVFESTSTVNYSFFSQFSYHTTFFLYLSSFLSARISVFTACAKIASLTLYYKKRLADLSQTHHLIPRQVDIKKKQNLWSDVLPCNILNSPPAGFEKLKSALLRWSIRL